MKAVVLEIKENWAAVLCEDGVVRKIKKGKLSVGDSLDISPESCGKILSLGSFRRYIAGSAAALFLLTAGAGGVYSYNNVLACSYVSLDINPSIEYTLNRQNYVIKVKGLNEEGQGIVDELIKTSLHHATLEEALEQTKLILSQKKYLNSDAGEYVLINVSASNDRRMNILQEEALSAFSTEQTQGKLNLVLTGSTLKEHKTASSLGISTGTYQQIQYIKAKSQKDEKESSTDAKTFAIQPADIVKYKNYTVSELLESSGQTGNSNNAIETSVETGQSVDLQSSSALQEEKNNQKSPETDSNRMPESSKNNKEQSASQTEKNTGREQEIESQNKSKSNDKAPKNSKDKSLEEGQGTQSNEPQQSSLIQSSEPQQSTSPIKGSESQQSNSPIQSGESQQNNSSVQGNEPKQNGSLPQSNDSNNTLPQSNDLSQSNDSMRDNTPGSMR
ncbi:hypothetical protein HMPREF9970_1732 [Lachnoanaerobaculum saburreum F0468]|jgi:hypothetical protein|uniref:RsgI N-terminal anti-sigma domain-containing protein n=1 Tax=Lachnoanaerobaculum saburreum F0468 TaxID=1095750 RepID=I0R676_9FIRM|nr:hypothetical protein [Lachnoanaerobaculum saburreum]EIC95184.1 hypothetical protein HMPREF9970_1732 [Lachnoanaerobaculum saburreum F0468]